jgi:hypothetical protein
MSDRAKPRKRLTAEQKQEREAFAIREARTRTFLRDQMERANKLRSNEKEFHGLEREFVQHQDRMLRAYEESKDIKHPRDVGNVREELLKAFFLETKLLPPKYAVSEASVRVAATSGHLSSELDILFYDAANSFALMQRQGVYEVWPVECCYGAIQVKSRLGKAELIDALDNIASFKRLKTQPSNRGGPIRSRQTTQDEPFGIIFAYDTSLDWREIVEALQAYADTCERQLLPNAVFILSQGFFVFGDGRSDTTYNSYLTRMSSIQVHGYPDRQGQCLFHLYSTVFTLLQDTLTYAVNPLDYHRLPLTAGDCSYRFEHESFVEFGRCEEHGDFPRRFSSDKLKQVIDWCQNAEPVNWVRLMDLAYGKPGDETARYERQPGDVRVYNPDGLPLADILTSEQTLTQQGHLVKTRALAFDSILTEGMHLYIPWHYVVKESLLLGCPKCHKARKAPAKPRAESKTC